MENSSLISGILSVVLNLFLPLAIAYVAKSDKKIVNMAIAYVSSAVIGGLSAWAGGQFTQDVWSSVLVGITSAQATYNAYWKDKFAKQPLQP